jgi:hypothetical protein
LHGQVQVLRVAFLWAVAAVLAWAGPFFISMPWLPLAERALDNDQRDIHLLLDSLATLFGDYSPQAFVLAGATAGIIGGFLTGQFVRRWHPGIQPRAVRTIAVGWGAAWALAWIVPGQWLHSSELADLLGETFQKSSLDLLPAFMFVAGAVAGLIGGRIMLWQVASARQRDRATN